MSIEENRILTKKPKIPSNWKEIATFTKKYEAYWDDNFGWRYTMIRSNIFLYRKLFRDSSKLSVLLGKNGWLYYKGDRALDYTQHHYPFSEKEIKDIAYKLLSNKRKLENYGIKYLLIVVPNKHTIYPENLPPYIKPSASTRFDQLINYMSNEYGNEVNILDLRKTLLQKKYKGKLYEKTGTHWSELGAFIGYKEIIKKIAEILNTDMKPITIDKILYEPDGPFDLAKQLGIFTKENLPKVILPHNLQIMASDLKKIILEDTKTVKEHSEQIRVPFEITNLSGRQFNVVVFRDSFFTGLLKFFPLHFYRSAYYWQKKVDFSVIKDKKPNIVVHEIVERYLMHDIDSF